MAVATALLDQRLNALDGSSVNVSRNMSPLGSPSGPIAGVGTQAARSERSINQLTGRLQLFADLAVTLGPSLIPVGAVAIPAVAGLAAQLGVAAIAGGSAIVAFQGVGEAIKAAGEYNLDPTAANLEKAQEAMAKLGPDAAAFVVEFQKFRPVLSDIRDAAAEGWFPGLTESLGDFERLAPRVEDLFRRVGEAGGNLIADSAESLASPRWTEFFDFLSAEAPATLTALGETVGALAHGVAELWMAFDPLNDDFNGFLLDSAQGFDAWAAGLSETEGFQNFIDYVRTTGPQVADTLGALGTALIDIVQAAAPLGGPVLAAIEGFAKAISAIADSPIGPTLFAMASAFVVLNKALALTGGLMTRAGLGAAGAAGATGPLGSIATSARTAGTSVRALGGDLRSMRGEFSNMNRSQAILASGLSNTSAAAQRTRATLGSLSRGAAVGAGGVAAFAVASGAVGEELGFQNTAMLGLVGSMAGPWGAAVGAGVGLALDFAKAGSDVTTTIEGWNTALTQSGTDFSAQNSVIGQARADLQALKDDVKGDDWSNLFDMDYYSNEISGAFGDSNIERQEAALQGLQREAAASQQSITGLAEALTDGAFDAATADAEDYAAVVARLQPAMDKLGITQAELTASRLRATTDQNIADITGGAGLQVFGQTYGDGEDSAAYQRQKRELAELAEQMDSVAGRRQALSDVFNGIGTGADTAAVSASKLQAALDAIFGPTLGVSAATDAWTTSLRSLNDDLAANKTLVGDSNAAIQNREAIRSRVTDLSNMLTAEAAAGASGERLSRIYARQSEGLLKTGRAAGLSGKQLRGYLNELELTPEVVETIVRAQTQQAEADTRKVKNLYQSLPTDLQADIRANGIPKTRGEVNALVRDYQLTEKQRTALVTLRDLASRDLDQVMAALNQADRARATPTVTANTGQATSALGTVQSYLNSIQSKTITVGIHTVRTYSGAGRSTAGGPQAADGGLWDGGVRKFATGGFGENGRYFDRTPQIVKGGANILWGEQETGWEAYISGKPGMRDRNLTILSEAADRLGVGLADQADSPTGQIAAARNAEVRRDSMRHGASQGARSGAATGGGQMRIDIGPVKVHGTLQSNIGPVFIEGIAEAAAVRAVDADRQFDRAHMGG